MYHMDSTLLTAQNRLEGLLFYGSRYPLAPHLDNAPDLSQDLARLSYRRSRMKVNMHEAKSQLSRLAELAHRGEEVVICKAGTPWLRLLPYREHVEPRQLGGLEGQIWMSPDFDEEDEELIEAFENSKIFPDED